MTAEGGIRERQRIERRMKILECSLDMLVSRGYEATKIRDIAKKLHMSTGLFFNYFESKEKIYEELIQYGVQGPRNVLQLNTQDIPPIEFFEKVTEFIFDSIRSFSMTSKIFLLMAQTLRSETAPESVKKLVEGFDMVTPVIPLIERGQRDGTIKKGSPAALAVAYWGAVQGVAESFALIPGSPLPESSWIVDILRVK
jgi:AcrR family transcriptional regulator